MLRHQKIIETLTLEEKASLLSGATFWNTQAIEHVDIPSIMLTDGPHGLRKQGGKADHLGLNNSIPATCFPTAATLANSWDVSLVEAVGQAIGREAAREKVSVLLGPGLDIVRNPLAGRNFEYYSEDPYLTGKLAAASVRGIQSNGIAASPKHFAVNSQEHLRMSINEIVDERALREIHLEAFRYVVAESSPRTIMTSYNKVNGYYTNENTHLMRDILYGEWKFNGVAVTDWGGSNDRVAGLKAGNQLEMPTTGGVTNREVVAAVKAGELEESMVDQSVDDILELTFGTAKTLKKRPKVNFGEHHIAAIEAARRSIVLLKNEDAVLPLSAKTKVAVIGDFAFEPRYQGAGSSLVNPTQLDNAYEALLATDLDIVGFAKGFKRFGHKSSSLANQALKVAKHAEVVLLFLGLDESAEAEGLDRSHMRLQANQQELVEELSRVNSNIVVVLAGGSPIEMPFIKSAKAILHGYLGGQGGGTAISDAITGAVNPSGKLAVTYPMRYGDVPSAAYFPGKELTSEHRESIYVGYRYYETAQVPVLFPFGFGLSYTTFEYSKLSVRGSRIQFSIKNTGDVAGEEVAQVYVKAVNPEVFRPAKELKGFAKVQLEPGESKEVEILLDDHAFAYFNIEVNRWVVEGGEYEIQVGSSIQAIHLTSVVQKNGNGIKNPYEPKVLPSYHTASVKKVSDAEYEALIGKKLPHAYWDRGKKLGIEDTFAQLPYANILGRGIYRLFTTARWFLTLIHKPIAANNIMFVLDLPFKKLERLSGGKVSARTVKRVLKIIGR